MIPLLLEAMALRILELEAVGSRKSLAEVVVDFHMELGEAARVMVGAVVENSNELAGEAMAMEEVVNCSGLVEVGVVMVAAVNCI